MRRRDFIVAVGGVAVGGAVANLPVATRAQQRALPVVGYLSANAPESDPSKREFLKGLSKAGFVEGRNVAIEYRYARNILSRLPELAADLVRRRVDVLVAPATDALPLKVATSTIPIVFSSGSDPVARGLVASLARPGGNLTGATFRATEGAAKMAEVLHEAVPHAAMAWLFNPANVNSETQARLFHEAARLLGVKFDDLGAANEHDIDMAFAALVERHKGALVIQGDPLFTDHLNQLVALTLSHGIPAISQSRLFPEAGGLMSYGGSFDEASRIAGTYVGRILKGEKPADLPVQQSTRIEMVLNLKTAKTLGIAVPTATLLRASEVIE